MTSKAKKLQYAKDYYQKNIEKKLQYAKEYNQKNKEKKLQYAKKYRQVNKEKVKFHRKKQNQKYYSQTDGKDVNSKQLYSPGEIELIMTSTLSDLQLATQLGRTIRAIHVKRTRVANAH